MTVDEILGRLAMVKRDGFEPNDRAAAKAALMSRRNSIPGTSVRGAIVVLPSTLDRAGSKRQLVLDFDRGVAAAENDLEPAA